LKKNTFLHVFVHHFLKAPRKFHAGNELRGEKKRLVLMTAPFWGGRPGRRFSAQPIAGQTDRLQKRRGRAPPVFCQPFLHALAKPVQTGFFGLARAGWFFTSSRLRAEAPPGIQGRTADLPCQEGAAARGEHFTFFGGAWGS
jgi:hypothetical protein